MSERTKKIMASRLNDLMKSRPDLNTLQKIKAKSGVGYSTIRRIRTADAVDVQIGHVEEIAACFGLALDQFVSSTETLRLSSERMALIQLVSSLEDGDVSVLLETARRFDAKNKGARTAIEVKLLQLPGALDL